MTRKLPAETKEGILARQKRWRTENVEILKTRRKRLLLLLKTQDYAEIAAFNALLPVSRRRLRSTYLERLKWIHGIKFDAIHRKVRKTLQRFFDEDDMDFDSRVSSGKTKLPDKQSHEKETTP